MESEIENKIITNLIEDIADVISNEADDLIIVEIKEEDGVYECSVNVTLCNKTDMESGIVAVASRLLNDGYGEEEIEQILEPLQNNWRGF
jgi:hypothetical protein